VNKTQFSWIQRFLSYLRPKVIEQRSTEFNPHLEVALENGKLVLNAQRVNYSYGSLQLVFRSVFDHYNVRNRPVKSVLILGFGAGSIAELLLEHNKPYQVTGVEVDEEVVDLAKKYFALKQLEERFALEIIFENAITFAKEESRTWDLVLIDLFIDDLVPVSAQKPAFLEDLRGLVAPKGMVIFNRITDSPLGKETQQQFLELFRIFFPFYEVYHTLGNSLTVVDLAAAEYTQNES
jgi:spermidine synthase